MAFLYFSRCLRPVREGRITECGMKGLLYQRALLAVVLAENEAMMEGHSSSV